MIDLPTIVSSALGTAVVGILLLTSAPLWWRWLKRVELAGLRKNLIPMAVFAVLIGILAVMIEVDGCMETESIPSYHPTFTEEEIGKAFSECQMKSIEVTSEIKGRSSRTVARRNYRRACLWEKGFRFSPADK